MVVKSFKGKVYGANLTAAEKKAMDIEIRRQLAEREKDYAADLDALVLYTLMTRYGWKKKRLREFWDAFVAEHTALREFYLMDDPGDSEWLAHRKLKDIGVDVRQWYIDGKGEGEGE
jgi:hypothetical protein